MLQHTSIVSLRVQTLKVSWPWLHGTIIPPEILNLFASEPNQGATPARWLEDVATHMILETGNTGRLRLNSAALELTSTKTAMVEVFPLFSKAAKSIIVGCSIVSCYIQTVSPGYHFPAFLCPMSFMKILFLVPSGMFSSVFPCPLLFILYSFYV